MNYQSFKKEYAFPLKVPPRFCCHFYSLKFSYGRVEWLAAFVYFMVKYETYRVKNRSTWRISFRRTTYILKNMRR